MSEVEQRDRAIAENMRMREALEKIERWELPETGKFWESGNPMSYEVCWGSNGAREYMRSVARAALLENQE